MTNYWLMIFFLILLLTAEFFNDVVVKRWTEGGHSLAYLGLAFVVHVLVFTFWVLAMKYESFSKVITVYSTISIVGGIILGYVLFHDKFSIINWIGVGLGIVSIYLMNF